MLLLVGPSIDQLLTGQWVLSYQPSVPALQCLALSCAVAVLVNVSQFMCLGRFSAVTFQVREEGRLSEGGRGRERTRGNRMSRGVALALQKLLFPPCPRGTLYLLSIRPHAHLISLRPHTSPSPDPSPPPRQVLGHTKTVLVLAMGWLILHDHMTQRKLLGMALAVVGMVSYGYLSSQPSKPK